MNASHSSTSDQKSQKNLIENNDGVSVGRPQISSQQIFQNRPGIMTRQVAGYGVGAMGLGK
jgi:hypothetical protein